MEPTLAVQWVVWASMSADQWVVKVLTSAGRWEVWIYFSL